jgi:hypothetical protein
MQALIAVLRQDPLLAYSVAAALVLLTAALTAGFGRLDFVAVFHPHGLLALVSAVLASLVLMVLIVWLERSLLDLPWLWLNLPERALPLVGAWRLPLYVVALAYGPSAGLAAGALIVAFSAQTGLPGWQEGLLAFELVTVGWLAIAPNPRVHPWAGTFNILLAHLLTLMTMGLAILRWQQRPLILAELWQLAGEVSGGVLLSALIVAYVTPAFYARVFTNSRIAIRNEPTPHMPLPPLTATPHYPTHDQLSTSSAATNTNTAEATPSITPAAAAPATQGHDTTSANTTSANTTSANMTSADTTSTEAANADTRAATDTATKGAVSKRPKERQLSVPAFFEVDTVDRVIDRADFDADSFDVDSFDADGFDDLDVDSLEADKG